MLRRKAMPKSLKSGLAYLAVFAATVGIGFVTRPAMGPCGPASIGSAIFCVVLLGSFFAGATGTVIGLIHLARRSRAKHVPHPATHTHSYRRPGEPVDRGFPGAY